MEPVYISIGSDCAVADYLRDCGRRDAAFPFDWMVSYGGIFRVIADATQPATIVGSKPVGSVDEEAVAAANRLGAVDASNFNAAYGAFHMHMPLPLALPTLARRFERLRKALADDRPVVLIRRSHALHHHFERASALCDEVADAKSLARHLEAAYPAKAAAGGFRIELMLACDMCHPKTECFSEGMLRVHNLTRELSKSFALYHPTKSYTDAMQACISGAIGATPRAPRVAPDNPYILEQ